MSVVMSLRLRFLPVLAMVAALLLLAETRPAAAQSVDKSAAPFALEVLQGTASGSLEDSRGKVVILEFWATYCGWCKATHPKLAAFAEANADEVVVLGISAQKKSRLKRYLKRHDTGLTILHDPKARISRAYRANATPTLVVIDAEGNVRAWAQGGNKLKSILRVAASLVAP
jgi:thiol-disulfide isomerase/thioredoxin